MMITAMAMLVATSVYAEQPTITAYVRSDVPARNVYVAERRASAVFASAGVNIQWRSEELSDEVDKQRVVEIQIVSQRPTEQDAAALAFALPYEGVHVTVFYPRIVETMPERPEVLLAYVMVHEITHLLEGCNHHSKTGIMKARWDGVDNDKMQRNRFVLSAEDVRLIADGLARRGSVTEQARLTESVRRAPFRR